MNFIFCVFEPFEQFIIYFSQFIHNEINVTLSLFDRELECTNSFGSSGGEGGGVGCR